MPVDDAIRKAAGEFNISESKCNKDYYAAKNEFDNLVEQISNRFITFATPAYGSTQRLHVAVCMMQYTTPHARISHRHRLSAASTL